MLTVSGFYLLTGTAWAWLTQFKLSILGQTLLMNCLFKGHIMVLSPQAGSLLYHCTLVLYRLESVCCCAYVDVKAKPSSSVLKSESMANCTTSYPIYTKERAIWNKNPQRHSSTCSQKWSPQIMYKSRTPAAQSVPVLCQFFLSNLIAVVGRMRDRHSSRLVKSPHRFCDNASCVVLVSLY